MGGTTVTLFERQRRVLMTASMMGIYRKIQKEREVVLLVAEELFYFSIDLANLGERNGEFPLPHALGDQVKSGGGTGFRSIPSQRCTRAKYISRSSHRNVEGEVAEFLLKLAV